MHNEQCPECAKRGKDRGKDNLGVYDDGSKFCFSCGYRVSPSGIDILRAWKSDESTNDGKGKVGSVLPDDISTDIPDIAFEWLTKYEINQRDLMNHRLMWSESRKCLIFPVFDSSMNLLAWQGRYFGENPMHPKWVKEGSTIDIFHILPIREHYETIVLVEDIVSAIKISKIAPCMPIFGSAIGYKRLSRLSNVTNGVVIWLDSDKRKEAAQESHRAGAIGLSSRVVFSDHDPKVYSLGEIILFLNKGQT